jgi:hypothetical protein
MAAPMVTALRAAINVDFIVIIPFCLLLLVVVMVRLSVVFNGSSSCFLSD